MLVVKILKNPEDARENIDNYLAVKENDFEETAQSSNVSTSLVRSRVGVERQNVVISQLEKEINQTIFNINNININEGHAIIGNKLGNDANINANISYTTTNRISKKNEPSQENWSLLHSSFSNHFLIQEWTNNNFSYSEVREWINRANLAPNEANFAHWLQNEHYHTPQQVADFLNLETWRERFQTQQLQANIETSSH